MKAAPGSAKGKLKPVKVKAAAAEDEDEDEEEPKDAKGKSHFKGTAWRDRESVVIDEKEKEKITSHLAAKTDLSPITAPPPPLAKPVADEKLKPEAATVTHFKLNLIIITKDRNLIIDFVE